MKKIAKFEKISFSQFEKDCSNFSSDLHKAYEAITLPKRATKNSAGYDFISPFSVTIKPNETVLIPTGIRAYMEPDYVLVMAPRSSLGFKYQLNLCNTLGIIDSDYYQAKNEGHIMIKLVNRGDQTIEINALDKFVQGIFLSYGIVQDDEVNTQREGGLGSSGK